MLINVLHKSLIAANLLLLLACFYFGPRLRHLCLVALWLNALALAVLVIPIFNLLLAPQTPSQASVAVKVLFTTTIPVPAEFVALLMVYRWGMQPR